MDKIFLIDANALVYRAYYAFIKNPRITSSGQNTSAVFGFALALDDLIRTEAPTHIAAAFDPHGGTFRHRAYAEYKAQREATPDDIRWAVPQIKRMLKARGISVFEVEGYEADDVIGTLAHRLRGPGREVYMLTPDKDYAQLVRDGITMYRPSVGGKGAERLGTKEVNDKYGITDPRQVIDLLALMGDSADNIPGCPGVGEKTAQKLVAQFGSVENLLANTAEVKGALRAKVEAAAEQIRLCKWLATIVTNVPMDCNIDQLRLRPTDNAALTELYKELEFSSLIPRVQPSLFDDAPADEPAPKQTPALPSRNVGPEEAVEICCALPSVGVMIGTQEHADLLSPIACIDLCTPSEVLCLGSSDAAVDALRRIMQCDTTQKVAHDVKRLMGIVRRWGIELKGEAFDLMIAHYLCHPDLPHPAPESAACLLSLRDELSEEMKSLGVDHLFRSVEMPLVPILAQMEADGVCIDVEGLRQTSAQVGAQMAAAEEEVHALAGFPFNVASPKQVGEVLFDRLQITQKAKKTKTGQYVTSEEVLEGLRHRHPIVEPILRYRALRKLLSTYIDALPQLINPQTGHIHTSFNQAVTLTGRLSSSNPNLQNIPVRTGLGKEVRKAFVPERGELFLSADYSQIELRVMAHLSHDEALIEAFRQGNDIHAATAARIFGMPIEEITAEQRRLAKTANFGIIYGISAFGLAERLGISRGEAKQFIEDYFLTYPGVKAYMERSISEAREQGYTQTIFGRRLVLPDINARNAVVRGYAERTAINAPIQGSAADIMKIATIRVAQRMKAEGLRSKLILQVHDELNFSVPPAERLSMEALVSEEMQGAAQLLVPLIADLGWGSNWLEAH